MENEKTSLTINKKEGDKMRKSGSGIGGVYYDKTRKKFVATYYEKNLETGKNIRKRKEFNTEEEAKNFKNDLMYQQENPLFIENHGLPLGKLMELNLNNKLKSNLISQVQYDRVLRTQARIKKSYLYNKNIDEIKPEEIQEFLNSLIKELSNSSIKKIKEQFTQAFRYSMDRGYLSLNPMATVITPKSLKKDKKVRALTLDEQQRFVAWLLKQNVKDYPYRNIYLIQMFCGLRIGEVLSLKRSDIDLKYKKIDINRTLTTLASGEIIMKDLPKTKSGVRRVPYPPNLEPYLIEQIGISKEYKNNDENLLFKPQKATFNKYVDRENVNTQLKKTLKNELGITGITTHSLRHTYGTRCIEAGVQPTVVQKNMGHADVSVTLNVYTDVFDEFKAKEQEKLNDYYANSIMLNDPKLDNLKYIESDSKEIEK